jgi:hypothetical protein
MKNIIAHLINFANQLDDAKLYGEATRITKIAQEFPDDGGELKEALDAIEQSTQTTFNHDDIVYGGNDGEEELGRSCWGHHKITGEEFEGWEEMSGFDEDTGQLEYSVVEWWPAASRKAAIHAIIRTANSLDKKGAHKFADALDHIMKL